MSSAIVLVVIAGAWAFVLVPMVRQRHETSTELRSVDRFASAMRVLARRPSRSSRLVTPRPASRPVVSSGVPGSSDAGLRAAERSILFWRRRVCAGAVVGFALLLVVGLALWSVAGLVVIGFGFGLVGATLVWLRRSARPAAVETSSRVFRPSSPVTAPSSSPSSATRRIAVRPARAGEPVVEERIPARLRPDRRVVARAEVVREEIFVDHEPTWGVRVLDLNAAVRPEAADGDDELFDQTRLTG